MTKFLFTFALVLIAVPAMAQTPGKEGIEQMCLTELAKENQLAINPQQYCGCIGTRLARHEGKLEHMDGARVRKQVMDDLRPCFDDHMKPAITTACDEMNGKLVAEGEKMKIDCSCYYNNMLDSFGTTWAGNLTNQPITPEQQAALAQQGVMQCMKGRP